MIINPTTTTSVTTISRDTRRSFINFSPSEEVS
jgi:hypothetical protein